MILLILGVTCLALTSCSNPSKHFKQHLKDPDSYEEISCEKKTYHCDCSDDGTTVYRVEYRAKNSFGGYRTGTYYACKQNGEMVCSECSPTPQMLWSLASHQ